MKTIYTRKLYYKQYNHRLVVRCRKTFNETTKPVPVIVEWLLATKFEGQYRTMNTWSDYRDHVTVYFKNPEIKTYLVSMLAEHITELEEPLDDTHTKVLEDDEKLITRKTLVYEKYRYIIRVPLRKQGWSTSTKEVRAIEDWCKEQFDKDDNRYRVHIGSRGSFYFADKEDAIVFKLAHGGKGVTTERVMLLSELESQQG